MKEMKSNTFQVILIELGPVGMTETARGGPEGASSSVEKKTLSDGDETPTSLCA